MWANVSIWPCVSSPTSFGIISLWSSTLQGTACSCSAPGVTWEEDHDLGSQNLLSSIPTVPGNVYAQHTLHLWLSVTMLLGAFGGVCGVKALPTSYYFPLLAQVDGKEWGCSSSSEPVPSAHRKQWFGVIYIPSILLVRPQSGPLIVNCYLRVGP